MSVVQSAYPSKRFQEVLLVLTALNIMGSIRSKEEVLHHIRTQKWLSSTAEDHGSYENRNEPKSSTLLCYARKDAVEDGWMFDHDERDHWEITRSGQGFLEKEKHFFAFGPYRVHRCYMWTPKFKLIFDPRYVPSVRDATMAPLRKRGRSFVDDYLETLST